MYLGSLAWAWTTLRQWRIPTPEAIPYLSAKVKSRRDSSLRSPHSGTCIQAALDRTVNTSKLVEFHLKKFCSCIALYNFVAEGLVMSECSWKIYSDSNCNKFSSPQGIEFFSLFFTVTSLQSVDKWFCEDGQWESMPLIPSKIFKVHLYYYHTVEDYHTNLKCMCK